MKYYTAKGDKGTTKLFNCAQGKRISKDDPVFEALGGLDELNSFVGLCRAVTGRAGFPNLDCDGRQSLLEALLHVQEDLFVIQAELGGSGVKLTAKKQKQLEDSIERFSGLFPEVRSFVIPGSTELGALLDVARTVARRTERLYVCALSGAATKSGIGPYLNRLSSFLYVLARLANYAQGERERAPSYR